MIKKLTSIETAIETGRLFVDVTEEDIVEGLRGCSAMCAISLAIGRMYGVPSHAYSHPSPEIVILNHDIEETTRACFHIPWRAQLFMSRFDDGSPETAPIQFTAPMEKE